MCWIWGRHGGYTWAWFRGFGFWRLDQWWILTENLPRWTTEPIQSSYHGGEFVKLYFYWIDLPIKLVQSLLNNEGWVLQKIRVSSVYEISPLIEKSLLIHFLNYHHISHLINRLTPLLWSSLHCFCTFLIPILPEYGNTKKRTMR